MPGCMGLHIYVLFIASYTLYSLIYKSLCLHLSQYCLQSVLMSIIFYIIVINAVLHYIYYLCYNMVFVCIPWLLVGG